MTDTTMNHHEYSKDCFFSSLADIKDKKITIMGLGLNGGGEASARFFAKHGAYLTITDMKTEDQLRSTLDALEKDPEIDQSRIRYVLGTHEIGDFSEADVVIKNPGVKFDNNMYLAAAKHIETDISIFLRFTKAPIIAVTGSKGKSSTVSAIHYGLTQAGYTSFLGGNITVSPLTFLDKTTQDTPVVLELSSWQLSDLRGRKVLKPKICILTKIVPDHQNWYGSMDAYVADKKLIYADQDSSDITICAADDQWGDVFAKETKGTVIRYAPKPFSALSEKGAWIDNECLGWSSVPAHHSICNLYNLTGTELLKKTSEPEIILRDLIVPGQHMRENVLNAALILHILGTKPLNIQNIMKGFPGIPHRLEFFHSWNINQNKKILFYNDSAATVPEAAAAALGSFEKPVHLICGGTDKVLDFIPLAQCAGKACSIHLLAGTGTEKLIPMLKAKSISYEGPYSSLKDLLLNLKRYISVHSDNYNQEEIAVLSPGATSFGMFMNEFDRGNSFKRAVTDLFC